MELFANLLRAREEEQSLRTRYQFAPGEREEHIRAQAKIKVLYGELTAGREPDSGPAVVTSRDPKLEHWYPPIHVEDRVLGDEAFSVFAQVGDSHAHRVLRSWFNIYPIVDGVIAVEAKETVVRDFIAWPDSEASKAVHEPTLECLAQFEQLAELERSRSRDDFQMTA